MSIEQKKNELLEILQDPTAFTIDVPLSLLKFVLELDPTFIRPMNCSLTVSVSPTTLPL